MRTLTVETHPPYPVRVGSALLADVAALTEGASGVAVVADERVAALHLERLGALAGGVVVRVPSGEAAKTFANLERLLDQLVEADLDRESCLVALGGGATCDLTGLAGSLYMRGIPVVSCPTTLLAMVDASVGGKTAVNLAAGKNLAGTFHHPRAVLADVDTLATLDDTELRSGLGEVLKSALLAGEDDLSRLEDEAQQLIERDGEALSGAIHRSVALKARVVAEDPLEGGLRKQLNLGHTYGHALEHLAGYGRLPHGVAVAAGIGAALSESRRRGLLEDEGLPDRVARLAAALDLPRSIEEAAESCGLTLSEAELVQAMAHDKKRRGGRVRLVLLRRAGDAVLDVPLDTI